MLYKYSQSLAIVGEVKWWGEFLINYHNDPHMR